MECENQESEAGYTKHLNLYCLIGSKEVVNYLAKHSTLDV